MKYDADWVREQVLAADAYRLDARACSICGSMVGYDFMFGEDVRFDGNCDCVSYWTEPRPSSYEAISDWLFMQRTDADRDRIMAGMKSRAQALRDMVALDEEIEAEHPGWMTEPLPEVPVGDPSGGTLSGDAITLPEGALAFRETGPVASFTLSGSGDTPLLILHHDGRIESGLNTAEEAARVFVESVTRLWPDALDKARKDEREKIAAGVQEMGSGYYGTYDLPDEGYVKGLETARDSIVAAIRDGKV